MLTILPCSELAVSLQASLQGEDLPTMAIVDLDKRSGKTYDGTPIVWDSLRVRDAASERVKEQLAEVCRGA